MHPYKFCTITRKGIKSSINQDSFSVPLKEDDLMFGSLFVVCDGVGGYPGGEIASSLCTNTLHHDFYQFYKHQSYQKEDFAFWIEQEILKINRLVLEEGKKQNLYKMSTTLAGVVLQETGIKLFSVGDSRIYRFCQNKLGQITEDHSLVWQQYIWGEISKDDMVVSPQRHIITTAIGLCKNPLINYYQLFLPEKYTLLLTTDGLTDVSTDHEIELVLQSASRLSSGLSSCLNDLYLLSQKNGSRDDVTMILISNELE